MRIKQLVHALVVTATLIVGVLVVAIAATQTAWFKNWLRGYITREARQYLNGELSIGRLGGNLFFGIELEDVGIALNGRPVISVKDIALRYNSLEFLRRGISVQSIRIDRPILYLTQEDQTWSIALLVKKESQEANRQGPGRPITIDDIAISSGSVVFARPFYASGVVVPTRIDDIEARLGFKYEPVRYSIEIAHVSLRGTDPDLAVTNLSGAVSVRNDEIYARKLALSTSESSIRLEGAVRNYLTNPSFKMQMTSDRTSLPELGRIVPSLAGWELQPAYEVKVDGPLDHLSATVNLRSSAGDVNGQLVTDLVAPDQSVRGEVTIRHLDLAPLLHRPDSKSDLTAVIKTDVHAASFSDLDSFRGTVEMNAPRTSAAGYTVDRVKVRATLKGGRNIGLDGATDAYGAAATFSGSVTLPQDEQPIAFDLRGGVRRVNLAKLPRQLKLPPSAETNLNGAFHASGTGTASARGDVRLADSLVAGTHLASGSTLAFSVKTAAGESPQIAYQADVTASDLDLQRVGRAFAIQALDNDRYRTTLNIHARADGRGTSPASMEATIGGEVTASTLFGGHVPQLGFDATLGQDTLRLKAQGSVTDLDPSIASGRAQAKGMVAGSLDVDATVIGLSAGVDPDHIDGIAKVTLSPSQVGGLRIDRGSLDARYQRQRLDVRTLEVAGADVMVQASGTVNLTPDGASTLKVHADSSNLTELGKLINQPLTGIATVDATVTGNRTNVNIGGNLMGAGVSAGGNGALTLTSEYTVDVPNLTVQDAIVSATTDGTFVTIGGQHINKLTAKTRYEHSRLDVDVTASQAPRTMSATGTVLLQPDEQELRLTRLDLTEQNLQWHLGPESEACIRYGRGVTTVKDLRLASGDQQIVAEGTFGAAGESAEPLTIRVKNLDLTQVDALLMRPPQFSGVLNGSATISGSVPDVKAEFEVNQGGFRGFHYDTFKGTAAYNGKGVTVDSRLQQSAMASLRAAGYVPVTAFKTATGEKSPGGAVSPTEDRFDLRIESTPIDLGIVQGFTTAVTGVTGTAQANVHVTGSGDDPRPKGSIVFTDAAFKVEATGVPYTRLNGRIDFQDDRVHIANLDVSDNASSWLSLTGEIPIRQSLTGEVSLQITARDFKVLDNKMGHVRIDSDLSVAGELRAPRVEGDLALSTGTINLDPLIAETGGGAYATKPAEYLPPSQAAQTTPPSADQPAGFAGVQMNIHVTMPNDLVIKSSDLRTPSAPIGLGALNVTLGGDLRATKGPNQGVRLDGTVNAVRGSYEFQSRQFTILRDGLVRFNGDPIDQLNPTLDLKTQRIIQGVQANADIRGTLQRPRIELTSVPPLERGDILSLIVFNQPVNQLGEGQQISLNQRAEQLALGSIAGELSKSLGSLLNVSEFQIQASPESGAAAQLTIGQQVSQRLFVKVEQGIGDVSTTNAVLEYELTDWLRLQTNLIQAVAAQQALFQAVRDSGFDLIFMFSR